jgi:hypothetical protein
MTNIAPHLRIDSPFRERSVAPSAGAASPAPSPGQAPARGRAPALMLRAMTGFEEEVAEERLGTPNTAQLCDELIARCLGPPGADFSDALARVRALNIAQRDEALIALRRLSFGDRVDTRVTCPACGKGSDVDFNLSSLPIAVGHAPERIEVASPDNQAAVMRPPNAGDQEDLLDAGLALESQRRSWLLARVLLRYGDREGPFDLDFARALPVSVRAALEAALEDATPALDLSMAVVCNACGHEFSAAFDVAAFFLPR